MAERLLRNLDDWDSYFVAFDTETTGLWAPSNRIVELGAVRFTLNHDRTEIFSSLIRSELPIPPEVTRIHGITDEMIYDAPLIEEILPQFFQFCGPAVLVAHNAPFDISFVRCEADRVKVDCPRNPILDTVVMYRQIHPNLHSYSLLALSENFRLAESQKHRALADAEMVMNLIRNASAKGESMKDPVKWLSQFTYHKFSDWGGEIAELPPRFAELQGAALEELRLSISYRNGSGQMSHRNVQPRRVYLLRGTYYLIAFCEHAQAERTFRCDRIEEYRVVGEGV
jgi:DNA polymerase III epsilon subunit family exonuclease